jgi:hypothetical protein
MRNCGVDQREKFTLGSGGIVEDLLRDIDEADHELLVFGCLSLDDRLLDLEKFELWDELVVDIFH